ncbi:MAG: hypothetical protein HYW81_01850 [Parcubacteria group bacterium]|nr:hypothetical protein [Parcubacteria group bacterium]
MAKKLMAHSTQITFGVFLVILGLLLFARQMGFVDADFPGSCVWLFRWHWARCIFR